MAQSCCAERSTRYRDRCAAAPPAIRRGCAVPCDAICLSGEFSSGPLEGLRLDLGVENLTDQDPPILAFGIGANTDPAQYDVLGRRYFVSLRYAL
jgi:hypothetical protein